MRVALCAAVVLTCACAKGRQSILQVAEAGWPVRDGVFTPGKGPAAHVLLADIGQFPPADGSVSPVTQQDGDAVSVVHERDGFRLEDRYEPIPALDPEGWRRSVVFTNGSDKTVDLVRAKLGFQAEPAEEVHHQAGTVPGAAHAAPAIRGVEPHVGAFRRRSISTRGE